MKLHSAVINEQQGPVSHRLILDEIITRGGATNHYQVLVLSLLTDFFKGGCKSIDLNFELPVPISSASTSVDAIEAIKSLSPSDQVNLAQYLLDCVNAGYSALHAQHMCSSDWLRYVLAAEVPRE